MTDNERAVIELQDEIKKYSETINKIFSKYKSVLDEYIIMGIDVRKEMFLGIDKQCKAIEEMSIVNQKKLMQIKHEILMKPLHRLSHLFVLLEDETISEVLHFKFMEEKDDFIQVCKNNGIEYSVQNFPDKKISVASKKDIKIHVDDDIKCEYVIEKGCVIITQCLEYYKPNIIIPEKILGCDVKEIGARAFYGCDEIIIIKLPTTLSRIGNAAFGECKRLRNVNGWNTKSNFKVESKAFWKTDIRRIDLSMEQVRYVKRDAFEECKFLLSINIHGTGIGSYPFKDYFNVSKQCRVNVYRD